MFAPALAALISSAHAGPFLDVTADAKANWIAADVMARPTVSLGFPTDHVTYVTSVGVAVPTQTMAGTSHGVGGFVREQFRVRPGTGPLYLAPELSVGLSQVDGACVSLAPCRRAKVPYLDAGLAVGADVRAGGLHYGVEGGLDLGGAFVRASLGIDLP